MAEAGVVTSEELRAVSQRVGEIRGWDFSRLNMSEETPPWQYDDVVRGYLRQTNLVADIGTGGGEVFSAFAKDMGWGYGLDRNRERLAVASQDGRSARIDNIGYAIMDARALAFGDRSLDVVLAKYADFSPSEVYRVLRPGGVFITQQMGDHEMASIFETFGGVSFGDYWRRRFAASGDTFRSTRQCGRELEALGAHVVRYDEYDLPQFFQDLDSLVFYLKASPLPEPFDPALHADAINRLQERYGTERGIQTNAHRELLVVRRL